MIKEIRYTGVTATPSDYISPDGELDAAINLVPENGELVAEQGGEVVLDLNSEESYNGFKPIYIHSNSSPNYRHIILANEDTGEFVWIPDVNKSESYYLCQGELTDTGVFDVISMGNTLILLSKENTHFVLWDDKKGSYEYLGTKMPDLPIAFGLQTKIEDEHVGDDDNSNFDVGYINNVGIPGHYLDMVLTDPREEYQSYPIPEGMRGFFNDKLDSVVKKLIAEKCTNKNKFALPFFVRCAFKLRGKDEWINRSSPVLMIPLTVPAIDILRYEGEQPVEKMAVQVSVMAAQLDYAVLYERAIEDIKRWGDIIESVDVFVSKPMYFYEQGKGLTHIINITETHQKHYNIPRLSISKGSEPWIGSDYYQVYLNPNLSPYRKNMTFAYEQKKEEDIRDIITKESTFYRVASIKLEQLTTERTLVELKENVLQSLVGQTPLDEIGAAHDHNKYTYDGSFVYNSRLIFYGINKISGVTSIHANTLVPFTNYENGGSGPSNIRIYTAIEKQGKKVYKHNNGGSPTTTGVIGYGGQPIPFLFLPEPEITDIAISHSALVYGTSYDEFKAEPHAHLSGVYLYLGWENFIQSLTKNGNIEEDLNTQQGGIYVKESSNQLFLSDVNNPFLFASSRTVDIDADKILSVQSAVKAMSTSQFGQYPLYIFTSSGVGALGIASDGAFSNMQIVTNDICTNPKSITKLDTSVLFTTDRGIMLLSGSEPICISEAIDSPAAFTTDILPKLGNLPHGAVGIASDMVPFREFLPNARMLYDYNNQRIIVYNPEQMYAYVYSLKSKQWGMMESHIKYGINSYSECLAVDDKNNIVNMSKVELEDGTKDCLIISRPLKLDDGDLLKTIDTIITRGKFRKGAVKTILYGSRDLFSWHLVASSVDHYLRGFRGTPYKYFRIVLACDLQKDESIFGSTIQYTPRLVDKIR